MAVAGIVFGQYLIFARPQTFFLYEFNALTALFYFFALIFGLRAPDFAARYGLLKFDLISKKNKRPLLAGALLALIALIVVGMATGLLVSPGAVQAKLHLTGAVSQLDADDLNQAKVQLELALDDYEPYADAHFLLGLLEGNDFALDAAADHFNRALEIGLDDEQYAEAHFQLGLIGWYRGDYQPTMDHLTMAIDGGYENGDAYSIRGMLLVNNGEPESGAADLKRALALGLDPDGEAMVKDMLEGIEAGGQEVTAPQEQPGFSDVDSLEMSGYDRVELYQAMSNYLSVKDLQDVADTVGANYDDLGGSGKSGKARELILYCERRDRIPDLLDALAQVRPDSDWHGAAGLR
jgi:tetratricopeptide (TPR) repeat protein